MSRIQTQLKIHELKGSRLPYRPEEAEVHENEYAYLDADGIAIPDGEGILYWVDTIVTTDAGGSKVYDNTAASGRVLSGAYATKKDHSVLNSWDPPKRYYHGVYVDLSTSMVEVCYKPLARNLRCTCTVAYAPGTKNLISRATIRISGNTRALVTRLTSRKMTLKSLVTRVTSRRVSSKSLVTRITAQLSSYSSNVVCRVTVIYGAGTSSLVSRTTIRRQSTKSLVCHLYADRTE